MVYYSPSSQSPFKVIHRLMAWCDFSWSSSFRPMSLKGVYPDRSFTVSQKVTWPASQTSRMTSRMWQIFQMRNSVQSFNDLFQLNCRRSSRSEIISILWQRDDLKTFLICRASASASACVWVCACVCMCVHVCMCVSVWLGGVHGCTCVSVWVGECVHVRAWVRANARFLNFTHRWRIPRS